MGAGRIALLQAGEMQDRKEFVHSSSELQPGLEFLDLFPKLGNDSVALGSALWPHGPAL